MKKIIRHIRTQPENVRRNILHISIFCVAIIMVLLWIVSLQKNLSDPDTQAKMKEDLKPFSTLKDSIVKENISE